MIGNINNATQGDFQMTNATQTTAQEERNINMYGIADIDAYVESVKESITYQLTGANMVVAGLMSDAQELIAGGAQNSSRQTLNIAKHILFLIMDGELIGTVERK
jgi:hypothetical protein